MIGEFLNIELLDIQERSDILDKPTREEVVVLHAKAMKYEWKEYAIFEESHHASGRELIVQFPEEALSDMIQLKRMCDLLSEKGIGENRDYEYVIRWNKKEVTFHLLFSERKKNVGRTPRIYTRDFWYDKKTNRQTKPDAKNAELRYKEGTFQRDRNGRIKYEGPTFLEKDPFFSSENWHRHMESTIDKLFKEYGFIKDETYELSLTNTMDEEASVQSELMPISSPSTLVHFEEKRTALKTKNKEDSVIIAKLMGLLTVAFMSLKKVGAGIQSVFKKGMQKISPFMESLKSRLSNATIVKKIIKFIS